MCRGVFLFGLFVLVLFYFVSFCFCFILFFGGRLCLWFVCFFVFCLFCFCFFVLFFFGGGGGFSSLHFLLIFVFLTFNQLRFFSGKFSCFLILQTWLHSEKKRRATLAEVVSGGGAMVKGTGGGDGQQPSYLKS